MNVEDCYQAGYIPRAHGIKGEVRAKFDVDDIRNYIDKGSFFLQQAGKMTLFDLQSFHPLSETEALLKFRDVNDRNVAETLRGATLHIPLRDLAPLEAEHQFYYHEIVGFTVQDANMGALGKVLRVESMPAQDVVVMLWKDKEVLIPITDETVLRADRAAKILLTDLPDGLVEMYLG